VGRPNPQSDERLPVILKLVSFQVQISQAKQPSAAQSRGLKAESLIHVQGNQNKTDKRDHEET
jgi:hypothetical protein